MDWPITDIARLAGVTSRTLRHYADVGLLAPSRIGANGYRYYDHRALTRLQRILMLRDLGLGIPAIREVLDGQRDDREALGTHRRWLEQERDRLDRQLSTVIRTIDTIEKGDTLMADDMFDGFDHTQYREEVEQRWGADAYAQGDTWWRRMTPQQREEWQAAQHTLMADWLAASEARLAPDSDDAQALARRQHDWLSAVPGAPRNGTALSWDYYVGLGQMYVDDERFAANYGGIEGATFVRDAMAEYARRMR